MNEMQSCSFPRASRTVCPDISVSFEFFPPATEAMEATLWESIKRLGAASAKFCLGDLWRRRLDPRAHACDGRADRERDACQACRASDLRRGGAGRDRRGRPRLLGHWRAPHRRAARRSARRTRDEVSPASGWLCEFGRAGCRNQSRSPISKSRWPPIRKATPKVSRPTPISMF